MTAKRFVARLAAVVLVLVFIVGVSVGAYFDLGSWTAVAVVWACVTGICGIAYGIAWGVANWNAQ